MNNRLIKFIITVCLIGFGLLFSVLCLDETNTMSLLVYHDNTYVQNSFELLETSKNLQGEFKAMYENLGMIKLRIKTFNRINTSHIRFQLKEKGADDWQIDNKYTVDRFRDGLLYPFGFPEILDSQNKIYEFKISSIDGTPSNSIGIDSGYHSFASQYVYKRSAVFSNFKNCSLFFAAKVKSILLDPYMILYMSIFFIPIFAYVFPKYGLPLAVYAPLIYTYLPISIHSNTALVMTMEIYFIVVISHITGSQIFIISLLWLVQMLTAVALSNVLATNRAATEVFFLMCLGVIVSIKELRKQ